MSLDPSAIDPALATEGDSARAIRRGIRVIILGTIALAAFLYAGKASDGRSAFIRWRPQVLDLMAGENIYETTLYPNPPIMAITLAPLAALPPVAGALGFFVIKVGLTVASVLLCLRMASPAGRRASPWVVGLIVLVTVRPILSDLHHGNNNLIILFLIVAALSAWQRGYDVLAGLTLALAITYKVTPALFVPYFLYKRSWRVVLWTFLGMGIFFLIVPGLVLGLDLNGRCLLSWWKRILGPYVMEDVTGKGDINQSMVGLLSRLLTESTGTNRYDSHIDVNFLDLPSKFVTKVAKGMSIALVGLLAYFCRTKATRRDDPRLLGEFSLVVMTMLFVSERSWKHHYVTILLPVTFLAYRVCVGGAGPRVRWALGATLGLAAALMATTSSELGWIFAGEDGHKLAQAYGMFFWAGVVLYAATAWRVSVEARVGPPAVAGTAGPFPSPHLDL